MCGRKYASEELTWAEYREILDITGPPRNLQPSYNIAPTQDYYVCKAQDGARQLRLMRWWLVPPWAKELNSKYPSFNAKAETLEEKASFKGLLKSNRCVVMTSGYYEWQHTDAGKQPYRIEHSDGSPMIFAGLWTHNPHLDLSSYTIVTTAKAPSIEWLHKRPAAILRPSEVDVWLNGSWNEAKGLATPFQGDLKTVAVSKDVGNVRNNHAELLSPI